MAPTTRANVRLAFRHSHLRDLIPPRGKCSPQTAAKKTPTDDEPVISEPQRPPPLARRREPTVHEAETERLHGAVEERYGWNRVLKLLYRERALAATTVSPSAAVR